MDNGIALQDGHPSGHSSLIHDLQLSTTGKRIVTCSTDRQINVWDLVETDNKQKFVQSGVISNAHSASVTKLSWAHHSYGQIIASCGLDNRIKVQQEVSVRGDKIWKILFDGVVGTGGVTDVKFSPRQFGLKIATASHDGGVKTLLASGSDFENWQQVGQFEPTKKIAGGGQRIGVTCLDWNPSTLEEREMLVMGTDMGAVVVWASDGQGSRDRWYPLPLHKDGVTNAEAIEHGGAVTDVAWAPSIGRGYHLIASSSKDGTLLINKLYPSGDRNAKAPSEYSVVPVFEGFGVHNHNNIWRISWNLTGTILASSGDDGYIMTWQQSLTETNPKTKELTWRKLQCLQPKNPSDGI